MSVEKGGAELWLKNLREALKKWDISQALTKLWDLSQENLRDKTEENHDIIAQITAFFETPNGDINPKNFKKTQDFFKNAFLNTGNEEVNTLFNTYIQTTKLA